MSGADDGELAGELGFNRAFGDSMDARSIACFLAMILARDSDAKPRAVDDMALSTELVCAASEIHTSLRGLDAWTAVEQCHSFIPSILARPATGSSSGDVAEWTELAIAARLAGCTELSLRCMDRALEIELSTESPAPEVVGAIQRELGLLAFEQGDFVRATQIESDYRTRMIALGNEREARASLWRRARFQIASGAITEAKNGLLAFLGSARPDGEIQPGFDDALIFDLARCEVMLGETEAAWERLETRFLERFPQQIPQVRAEAMAMLHRARSGSKELDPWLSPVGSAPRDSVGRFVSFEAASPVVPEPRQSFSIEVPTEHLFYTVAVSAIGPGQPQAEIRNRDGKRLVEGLTDAAVFVEVPGGSTVTVTIVPDLTFLTSSFRVHTVVCPEPPESREEVHALRVALSSKDAETQRRAIDERFAKNEGVACDSLLQAYLLSELESRVGEKCGRDTRIRLRACVLEALRKFVAVDFPFRSSMHQRQSADYWRADRTREASIEGTQRLAGISANCPSGQFSFFFALVQQAMRCREMSQWEDLGSLIAEAIRHADRVAEPVYLALPVRRLLWRLLIDLRQIDAAKRLVAEDVPEADRIPNVAARAHWLELLAEGCEWLGDPASATLIRECASATSTMIPRESQLDRARKELERATTPEHRIRATEALVVELMKASDFASALPLQQKVMHELPQSEPILSRAISLGNLAAIHAALGEHAVARGEFAEVLSLAERVLPAHHDGRVLGLRYAAWNLAALEDGAEVGVVLQRLVRAANAEYSVSQRTISPRHLAAVGDRLRLVASDILSLSPMTPIQSRGDLDAAAFSLIESARALVFDRQEIRAQLFEEQAPIAMEARAVLDRLARGYAAIDTLDPHDPKTASKLIALESEQNEFHELLELALGDRTRIGAITSETVAQQLVGNECTVSYFRRTERPLPERNSTATSRQFYSAFVVLPDARVIRVELGDASSIDTAIADWQQSAASITEFDERTRALRERIVDPVVAVAGDANRWFIVPDDALHGVSFDVLFDSHPSLALESVRLLALRDIRRDEEIPAGRPVRLVAFGGLDYGPVIGRAPPIRDSALLERLPIRRALRSALEFSALDRSKQEVESIVDGFRERFGSLGNVEWRSGREGTVEVFRALAPSATHLHLAIHGFSMESDSTVASDSSSMFDLAQAVVAVTPDSFAGLAFAGANAKDQRRHLLSAAEIATLELKACDLVVLSACQTSRGVRLLGQGIASVQTAFLTAGARNCIATLWPVRDWSTSEFMKEFYSAMWRDHRTVAGALHQARRSLASKVSADGRPAYLPLEYASFVLVQR